MSIVGNLRTMALAELLQWLSQGNKTGTLLIEREDVTKRIYFEDGTICASASSSPTERLGHFLVSHGFITEVELTKAIEMQEATGMLLGKILVTIGGISEADLRQLLVLKTEESIFEVFSWEEGDFRFLDGERLNRGLVEMELDVTGIVLQGMNRLDEWKRIREIIPSAGSIPVAIGFLEDEGENTQDKLILSAVDDDCTIEEICRKTHLSEFQVSRALFRQIEKGRLKLVTPRDLPPGPESTQVSVASGGSPTPSSTPQDPSSSGAPQLGMSQPLPTITPEVLLDAASQHLDDGTYTRALRHLRAALTLEPNNRELSKKVDAGCERIEQALADEGLDLDGVPELARSEEELPDLQLSPEEGFLLSRIDGSHQIRDLIKISSMDALDAQLSFHKLLREGHIRIQVGTAVS